MGKCDVMDQEEIIKEIEKIQSELDDVNLYEPYKKAATRVHNQRQVHKAYSMLEVLKRKLKKG